MPNPPVTNFESTYDSFTGRHYDTGPDNNRPVPSSIGPQLVDFYYQRKALIDLKRDMFFGQLADTTTMPKHMGKTIKLYHYIPLLDDRNINDQGIDATGLSTANSVTIELFDGAGMAKYFEAEADTAANAKAAAKAKLVAYLETIKLYRTGTTAYTVANISAADNVKTNLVHGFSYIIHPAVNGCGNLYGSSRDIGTITGKLPTLSENGGRVNRVGFTRVTLEGTIHDFGFFDEYTEDSIQFDTDEKLMSHISRETLRAANEISEDMLQKDLLNGAGVVMYGGDALGMDELAAGDVLTYDMFIKLDMILNNNRCPRDTKIITGSRMVDTRVVPSCRYAFVGPELKTTLMRMVDYHNNPAFIPVQYYAEAGTLANGEIGAVGNFRIIENPWMLHWDGKAASGNDPSVGTSGITSDGVTYQNTNGYVNVYPVLVVGSNAFTTIGFQTSGDSTKFKILHKAPGAGTADRHDPYGKTGFYSIQWWYGSMVLRPEWIACLKVVAPVM